MSGMAAVGQMAADFGMKDRTEKVSQQQSTSYTPTQKSFMDRAVALYGGQLGQNNNVWQGDRVAPMSGLQQGAIQGAGNFMGEFSTPQEAATPLRGQSGYTISQGMAGNLGAQKIQPSQVNSYFQDTLYNPTMQALKQDVLPAIGENYAGGNFFGSAKGKMQDKATMDTFGALQQQRAQLQWDAQLQNMNIDEAQANRQLGAAQQGVAYSQLPAQDQAMNLRNAASQVQGMEALFGFGQSEQTQEQRELEASMSQFFEQNQITDPANMQILMQLLSTSYSQSSSFDYSLSQPLAAWHLAGEGTDYNGPTNGAGMTTDQK